MMAPKMYCVSFAEIPGLKWRHSDYLGLQIAQGLFKSEKIFRGGKNSEISIAAKLGCAVKHACLAAH
jgi:hypothetical protein